MLTTGLFHERHTVTKTTIFEDIVAGDRWIKRLHLIIANLSVVYSGKGTLPFVK
jgi:hypothetical protein